ncbi:hypothetical protein [Streptomyces sp. MBT65]|uniref:hypothetical protein n=1 Tax=Streptomyces sp. MBT65 TaxID=1488395 RepID=UPI0027DA1058|nr:hypothetical protein [Streptomyces sp. MBT65]
MAAASASLPLPARSKRTAEPSAGLAPDVFFVDSEGAWAETPLTSEPPLTEAEPLTSEPPLADTAPLTSESATMDAPLTSEAAAFADPLSGASPAFADPDSTRP